MELLHQIPFVQFLNVRSLFNETLKGGVAKRAFTELEAERKFKAWQDEKEAKLNNLKRERRKIRAENKSVSRMS